MFSIEIRLKILHIVNLFTDTFRLIRYATFENQDWKFFWKIQFCLRSQRKRTSLLDFHPFSAHEIMGNPFCLHSIHIAKDDSFRKTEGSWKEHFTSPVPSSFHLCLRLIAHPLSLVHGAIVQPRRPFSDTMNYSHIVDIIQPENRPSLGTCPRIFSVRQYDIQIDRIGIKIRLRWVGANQSQRTRRIRPVRISFVYVIFDILFFRDGEKKNLHSRLTSPRFRSWSRIFRRIERT